MVGRYANRIAGSRYVLDGQEVKLPPNEGPNLLHGGSPGYHLRTGPSSTPTAASCASSCTRPMATKASPARWTWSSATASPAPAKCA